MAAPAEVITHPTGHWMPRHPASQGHPQLPRSTLWAILESAVAGQLSGWMLGSAPAQVRGHSWGQGLFMVLTNFTGLSAPVWVFCFRMGYVDAFLVFLT
jgi:hypothetical protein